MTAGRKRASSIVELIRARFSESEFRKRQQPKPDIPLPPSIRPTRIPDRKALDSYWKILEKQTTADEADKSVIAGEMNSEELLCFQTNIENCIGTVKVPLGVIGPLRVNGIFAQGDYYVPLATTEATLVASYGRGAKLISASGGCTTSLLNDGLSRTPGFAFENLSDAGLFVDWVSSQFETLKKVVEGTTGHGQLIDIHFHVEGNHVYLACEFFTGDAAGQNMTTIATEAICKQILNESPIKPKQWFIESNFSGDKKASALSFITVRGKKVSAEVRIPSELIEKYLHTSIDKMLQYWRMSALGGVMSGTIGVQGHYANGLTALYLATGQDAACASESSVGVTRMEADGDSLYCSVTLPNIIVGTVGGGTKLPSQQAGLKILGLNGSGNVHALAEICAALSLAGELSLIGAICAEQFAAAHQSLARGDKKHDTDGK